jgi:hypothetical protein
MDANDGDRISAELAEVARLLRERRPAATELELDAVKLKVKRRAARAKPGAGTRTKGLLMRSRIALVTVLALGIVMSATGVTLAVSGLAGDDDAAQVQYFGPGGDTGDEIGDPGISGDPSAVAETTEQIAATGDGGLPLTGFLAIPLLISGVALLTTGLVIRRKTRE